MNVFSDDVKFQGIRKDDGVCITGYFARYNGSAYICQNPHKNVEVFSTEPGGISYGFERFYEVFPDNIKILREQKPESAKMDKSLASTAFDVMKQYLIRGAELVGEYEVPMFPAVNVRPEDTVSFRESFSRKIKA